jgi:hypothetical protein
MCHTPDVTAGAMNGASRPGARVSTGSAIRKTVNILVSGRVADGLDVVQPAGGRGDLSTHARHGRLPDPGQLGERRTADVARRTAIKIVISRTLYSGGRLTAQAQSIKSVTRRNGDMNAFVNTGFRTCEVVVSSIELHFSCRSMTASEFVTRPANVKNVDG